MKITGIQYRNFYPQKSLNFDFKVYNYSSNHFEVGITGTHYVRYLFKSGIIKDPNDNIIGTFNACFLMLFTKIIIIKNAIFYMQTYLCVIQVYMGVWGSCISNNVKSQITRV